MWRPFLVPLHPLRGLQKVRQHLGNEPGPAKVEMERRAKSMRADALDSRKHVAWSYHDLHYEV